LPRHSVFAPLVAFALVLSALATNAAPTPIEAVGFNGTVTGTIKSAQADGLAFVLTVSKAEADEQKSAVKDTALMVGKALPIGTRMPRKDGKPFPSDEDTAYIKSLKPGDVITIKIFAVRGAPAVLRMQGPGTPATKPS
jgi:hypothetical protein